MAAKVKVKLTQSSVECSHPWTVREVTNSLWPSVGERLNRHSVEEILSKARSRGWTVTITEEKRS